MIADLDDVFVTHVLGSAALDLPVGDQGLASGIASIGRGFSQHEVALALTEPLTGERADLDGSGLSVGVAIRLAVARDQTFSPFVRAGWRVLLLDTNEFLDGEIVDRSTEPIWSFPITLGVRFRL